MIPVLKSHLLAEDKNTLALTVKIERVHLAYLARAERLKPVPINSEQKQLKKVATQVSHLVKILVSETQIPTHLEALAAGNRI